jgi:hypothetical protein
MCRSRKDLEKNSRIFAKARQFSSGNLELLCVRESVWGRGVGGERVRGLKERNGE